jgi:hypothetical protein
MTNKKIKKIGFFGESDGSTQWNGDSIQTENLLSGEGFVLLYITHECVPETVLTANPVWFEAYMGEVVVYKDQKTGEWKKEFMNCLSPKVEEILEFHANEKLLGQ